MERATDGWFAGERPQVDIRQGAAEDERIITIEGLAATVLGLTAGKTAGVALCGDGELFRKPPVRRVTTAETAAFVKRRCVPAAFPLQDISLLAVTAGPAILRGCASALPP